MINKSPWVRAVGLVRRNPELTPEQFRRYWLETHVKRIRDSLPGLRLYTGSFPVAGESAAGEAAPYDAVIELGFDSVESMQAALNSPAFLSEDRRLSSATFMIGADTMIVEQYVVEL